MNKTFSIITISIIFALTHTTISLSSLRKHDFSPSVSNQLSTAIREKIVNNLSTFSDQQFAKQLKQDLYTQKDQQRKLKQISPKSAQQLFAIFDLKGIKCDLDGDGVIKKQELQCLNYIWKYYVPE